MVHSPLYQLVQRFEHPLESAKGLSVQSWLHLILGTASKKAIPSTLLMRAVATSFLAYDRSWTDATVGGEFHKI